MKIFLGLLLIVGTLQAHAGLALHPGYPSSTVLLCGEKQGSADRIDLSGTFVYQGAYGGKGSLIFKINAEKVERVDFTFTDTPWYCQQIIAASASNSGSRIDLYSTICPSDTLAEYRIFTLVVTKEKQAKRYDLECTEGY